MARASLTTLDARITTALVVAAGSHVGARLAGVEYLDSAHPLPDERSVRSAERALAVAREAAARREPLLVLLSGGASAMLALPAPHISLDDKRRTIETLTRSGIDIVQLNCVRKHLSAIKGGQLACAAGACLTLALSDVHLPEDDASAIGSGPTVPDPTTFGDALDVLRRWRAGIPEAVIRHLERGVAGEIPETPKPGDPRLARSEFEVIANRHTAMHAAAAEARRLGYAVRVMPSATCGEARAAGHQMATAALHVSDGSGPTCVIASGEPTVTVTGSGRGGRNQEFALGAAPVLAAHPVPAVVASAGTDGIDGPTDAAGALATSATMARARTLGLDVAEALQRNDAYPLLARLGGLIKWWPTDTNVGDVHIVLTMVR